MTAKRGANAAVEGLTDGWAANPHMAALPPYNAGMSLARARSLSGHEDVARLASNENPDGCSPAVLAALGGAGVEPWRYADPACTALREALASRLQVDPDRIVFGNGSEEMIAAISRAILVPGALAVTVAPSFGLHEIEPLAAGARVVKVPMTGAAGFDLPALEKAIHAALVNRGCLIAPFHNMMLVSPATGTDQIDRLIAAFDDITQELMA